MISLSPKQSAFLFTATIVLSMLFFGCAGNREYAHYGWKGKFPQKHTTEAEVPVKLVKTSQDHRLTIGEASMAWESTSPKAEPSVQIPNALTPKAAKKRQVQSFTVRSFMGLESHRFENPMDLWLNNLTDDHISTLEEKQLAEDSLLWWGLVLCGIGLILLLLAGILGAGNGFVLAWLFWALGAVALTAGLIILLIYLLKMV